ncbi:serine/threonine-protein phosphatase [Halomicrobium sp. IBSBa]|uniref:PP2C family protein-serine/threonine phosphatase n=1 Tax=Halomicrobium sp. IBSBa TaxID=2778916 RepID=UPI001ABFF91D|nr:protein phosphatase 2C domain-containing protein [Halomicrobium sp. IBSBa]MBO4246912.1 serine/threonine-protein phosphatase [Halomicrobium sp. IBSBa]
MIYATNYDIGERKRSSGINEDSLAVDVIEQGHRDGLVDRSEEVDGRPDDAHDGTDAEAASDETGVASEERSEPRNRSVATFVLADGAGGYEAGDVASYIATTTITTELQAVASRALRSNPAAFDVTLPDAVATDPPTPAEIQSALEAAITTAHREIVRYTNETGNRAYTTVVAGLCFGGRCYYAWVGDSRAYLLNEARETIELLTRDHGVVAELRDRGEIDDVAAHVHPRGNEITRALGGGADQDPDAATVAVDSNVVPLYAEDVLLVTSDGLIDAQTDAPELYDEYVESDRSEAAAQRVLDAVVTDEEIREYVLTAESLAAASEALVEMANDRGGKDNLSTLFLQDPALPATPEHRPLTRALATEPVEDRETVLLPEEGETP